jgi:hypothetical protein
MGKFIGGFLSAIALLVLIGYLKAGVVGFPAYITYQPESEAKLPYPRLTDAVQIPNAGVCHSGDLRFRWNGRDKWCLPLKPQADSYLFFNKATGHLAWYNP